MITFFIADSSHENNKQITITEGNVDNLVHFPGKQKAMLIERSSRKQTAALTQERTINQCIISSRSSAQVLCPRLISSVVVVFSSNDILGVMETFIYSVVISFHGFPPLLFYKFYRRLYAVFIAANLSEGKGRIPPLSFSAPLQRAALRLGAF